MEVDRPYFLISLLVFVVLPLRSVFYTASLFRNRITKNEVWLFGDFHYDVDFPGTLTRLQQRALLEEAKKRSALIIAETRPVPIFDKFIEEDKARQKLSTAIKEYINSLKKRHSSFSLTSNSPLCQLATRCMSAGVPIVHTEFRYHEWCVSFSWIGGREYYMPLRWYSRPIFWGIRAYTRCMSAFTGNALRYQEIKDYCIAHDRILDEIALYNDGAALQAFYNECIKRYQSSYITRELYKLASEQPHFDTRAVEWFLWEKLGKMTLYSDLLQHDKDLLDARIVHKIYKNRATQTIFVCAGGAHIMQIIPVLKCLDYEEVANYGKDTVQSLLMKGQLSVDDLNEIVIDLEHIFQRLSNKS